MTAGDLYLGLMSGTSLDGVDVATVELTGGEERPEAARLLDLHTEPYGPDFRRRLETALQTGRPGELCQLNFELGRRFAAAVQEALSAQGRAPGDVRAVGSHGQTVWHAPRGEDGTHGATLQLGEPAVIAEVTGIDVVADFRVRDVAARGHGAPLTPYFDRLLLGGESSRAIQNLGGMGNVTALPDRAPGAGEAGSPRPVAFDTGPGVVLVDAAVRRLTGGRRSFDRDGALAARGRVLEKALEEWLEDPFFRRRPPRTTGRERFGPGRVEAWLARHADARDADLVATLTELTARSVAEAYDDLVPFEVVEVYLCGGGARNPELRRRLERALAPRPVRSLDALGWDGDAREAAAFALLARQHLLGVAVDLTWATGATGPRRLGKHVPA